MMHTNSMQCGGHLMILITIRCHQHTMKQNIFKYIKIMSLVALVTHLTPSSSWLLIKNDSKSFKNTAKRNGDIFSPCRTPILLAKKLDKTLFTETQD